MNKKTRGKILIFLVVVAALIVVFDISRNFGGGCRIVIDGNDSDWKACGAEAITEGLFLGKNARGDLYILSVSSEPMVDGYGAEQRLTMRFGSVSNDTPANVCISVNTLGKTRELLNAQKMKPEQLVYVWVRNATTLPIGHERSKDKRIDEIVVSNGWNVLQNDCPYPYRLVSHAGNILDYNASKVLEIS